MQSHNSEFSLCFVEELQEALQYVGTKVEDLINSGWIKEKSTHLTVNRRANMSEKDSGCDRQQREFAGILVHLCSILWFSVCISAAELQAEALRLLRIGNWTVTKGILYTLVFLMSELFPHVHTLYFTKAC